MMRITDIMKNNTLVRNLQRQQYEMDRTEHQLSTGQRIRRPQDDPAQATNQMFFRTRNDELHQFENNIGDGMARLNFMDGELGRVTDILQRIRVLTVQASNGIYQGDDGFELKRAFAVEIDQHLRALVQIANGRDSVGRPLFGGHVNEREPFEIVQTNLRGLAGLELEDQIINVNYRGDIGKRLQEVERDQYVDVNIAGNRVFWGNNMTVTGGVDASGYRALSDQTFRIDGTEIRVSAGDTVDDIIDRINTSALEVRASKVGEDNLSLHSTVPHQIWLEDMGSGTVLQDLGLLSTFEPAPTNYAEDARVSGMSLFDVVIQLRNNLLKGDQLEVGGRDLGNLDTTISNLLRHRADIGARQNRLEEHQKRVGWDITHMTELLAQSEGVDVPETIMNLKWLEAVHSYALNVGSRIIRPSLMDFLR